MLTNEEQETNIHAGTVFSVYLHHLIPHASVVVKLNSGMNIKNYTKDKTFNSKWQKPDIANSLINSKTLLFFNIPFLQYITKKQLVEKVQIG